jgi:hypothetical protein
VRTNECQFHNFGNGLQLSQDHHLLLTDTSQTSRMTLATCGYRTFNICRVNVLKQSLLRNCFTFFNACLMSLCRARVTIRDRELIESERRRNLRAIAGHLSEVLWNRIVVQEDNFFHSPFDRVTDSSTFRAKLVSRV